MIAATWPHIHNLSFIFPLFRNPPDKSENLSRSSFLLFSWSFTALVHPGFRHSLTKPYQLLDPGEAETPRSTMADMMGGEFGGGGAGQFPLEQWFYEMPVCTRWWTAATLVTSVLVQCHVLTPFELFYSYNSVFHNGQVGSPKLNHFPDHQY